MIPHLPKIRKERLLSGPILEAISVLFVLFFIGFLIFSNVKMSQRKGEVQNQISSIQNEINNFQKKNEQLKLQISKGLDEEYIERVARQDLGLQKQGEAVVGYILPPSQNNIPKGQNFWQPGSLLQGLKNIWNWLNLKF